MLSGLPGIGCTAKAPGEDSKAKGQGNNRNVWRTMKFGSSAVSIGVGVVDLEMEKACVMPFNIYNEVEVRYVLMKKWQFSARTTLFKKKHSGVWGVGGPTAFGVVTQ